MAGRRARILLMIAGVVGASGGAGTSPPATSEPALPAYSAERAYGYLEVLAGQIGERAAGTEAESRAVEYIASQFKSWGLEVNIQAVQVPVWKQRRARLWAEGEVTRDFPAKAIVFAGQTPAAGVSGGFVDLGAASDRDLRGKELKGKIVLIKRDVYIDYPRLLAHRPPQALRDRGHGVLLRSRPAWNSHGLFQFQTRPEGGDTARRGFELRGCRASRADEAPSASDSWSRPTSTGTTRTASSARSGAPSSPTKW